MLVLVLKKDEEQEVFIYLSRFVYMFVVVYINIIALRHVECFSECLQISIGRRDASFGSAWG